MGKLLVGEMTLKIVSVRNTGSGTDRYKAVDVSSGESVSVKFKNHGKDPHIYIGETGTFDGCNNDVQTEPQRCIDTSRPHGHFHNPFFA
jgi:hypothetical protein